MQLFALVENVDARVQRIPLQQSIQVEIHNLFVAQARYLLKDATLLPFEPGFNPESDELHTIDDFPDAYGLFDAGSAPLNVPVLSVNDQSIVNISGLFVVAAIDGVNTVCIQSFDRRRALTKGKFTLVDFGDGFKRLEYTGLTLDTSVSVLLQDQKLIFKSYQKASRFFDLTEYFHEATEAEVLAFAGHSCLDISDSGSFFDLAGTSRIRKQIAMVLDSGVLDQHKPKKIATKAKAFKLKLITKLVDGAHKLVMPDDRAELKNMLDFLLENFYKGYFSSKTYVSNSRRTAA